MSEPCDGDCDSCPDKYNCPDSPGFEDPFDWEDDYLDDPWEDI